MSTQITILCENSAGPISGTLGEHGFSALVEHDNGSLLFDTGQGLTLLHNAQRMNKNLHQVGQIALSHGHYDHSGGLLPLLRSCGPKQVFGHPGIFTPRYRHKDTGESLSLGMPYPREYLEGQGAQFDLSAQLREILPNIWMTGQVPRITDFESGDSGLYTDTCGCNRDLFDDDQSLIISCDRGLVILLGCCHAGLINTLEHVAAGTGRRDIYAVIGGTHLGFSSPQQLDQTVKHLTKWQIQKLAVSHCTGFNAAARLQREFPGNFQNAQVGYSLTL
ncbi:MAG: MBL fold metallo-hydrolase [Trichlorobacter sp.]|jgi:7,8-dihydropterin-6-yl-methyl-4-(beta-D-ribofuranosyl)aminobenzene 5'-phosphate synthase